MSNNQDYSANSRIDGEERNVTPNALRFKRLNDEIQTLYNKMLVNDSLSRFESILSKSKRKRTEEEQEIVDTVRLFIARVQDSFTVFDRVDKQEFMYAYRDAIQILNNYTGNNTYTNGQIPSKNNLRR